MKTVILFLNIVALSALGMVGNPELNTKSTSLKNVKLKILNKRLLVSESSEDFGSSLSKRRKIKVDIAEVNESKVKLSEFLVKSKIELGMEYNLDPFYIIEMKRKIKLWKKLNNEGKILFKNVLLTGNEPTKDELIAIKSISTESYNLLKEHLDYIVTKTKPEHDFDYKGLKLWKILAQNEMDLIDGVRRGDKELVKNMIDKKHTDINCRDKKGDTPLHIAVRGDKKGIIKFLVEQGAKINLQNNALMTPLNIAARDDMFSVVKYLVEHGADLNITNKKKNTPLHHAARYNHETIAKYLIDHGSNVNICNERGITPIVFSIREKNLELIKYLAYHGADINRKHSKYTLLDIAEFYGTPEIVAFLSKVMKFDQKLNSM